MPKKQRQTHLLIINSDQGSNKYVLEDLDLYSIGRHSSCDIRLLSRFVSRRHATLERHERTDGTYYYQIIDGNNGKPSVNGLMINGRKRQTHILQNNDEIIFGPGVAIAYTIIGEESDQFDITLIMMMEEKMAKV
ncbi:MAG: FHA domain-containing protein [Hormoscilla sp. GM7CHS1pb]|nr:FHA domain-containing protein [Hormoscilla sp. GM7CHS1pb]